MIKVRLYYWKSPTDSHSQQPVDMEEQVHTNQDPPGNKKILLLFYEPLKSGISRHVHSIISSLHDEHYDFWVLYAGDDVKISNYFNELLQADRIIPVPPHRFFTLRGFLRTRNLIRQLQVDTVHIHNLQSILWGYGGAIIAGCQHIVFTPHIDTECTGRAQWLFRLMWRLFDPFTSTLIALSESQKDWLIRWKVIQEKKITVIPNHISEEGLKIAPADIPDVTRTQLKGKNLENKFIVAQFGRLDRQKDPFFLIRAAQLLKREYPEIIFLMVGEGPLQIKVEKEIQHRGLQDNVLLTGHMNNIARLLKVTDVVSLTSRWEGMPYVLIEAACFKKAVVATDIPGNRDLVINNKNGFLVRSEEEFAQKLAALFVSPSLKQKMGETGYKMNRNLFNLNNMKDKMSSVY